MAISESFLWKKMSGHLGKQVVFKQYGDKTVVSKYPDMSRRKLTEKQKKVNEMMEEATYYAKHIMADAELKADAQVRLDVLSNRLYPALISEYFRNAREAAAKE